LEKRTKDFAIRIIRLSALLPDTQEAKVIRNQITKSGSSIGANYREANRSRSRADFVNKIKICESETNETIYWLELIVEFNWTDQKQITDMLAEANEMLSIFTAVGAKLRGSI